MSRDLLIAVLASILIHGGIAGSSYLVRSEKPAAAPTDEEVPTIALDLPPPPEPDEPEFADDALSDAEPGEVTELAPPMQNDVPSAVIDAPFVQALQPPVPQGPNVASHSIRIPPALPRPGASGSGRGFGNLFDLAVLDKRPTVIVQPRPQYPFELKRAGIEGEVEVGFVVDSTGAVRNPYIIRSTHSGFEEVVLSTVLKWRFRPGEKGGVPVNTRNVQIRIPFSLKAE